MSQNVTFLNRWVLISDFEVWEIVLFTILFSILIIVAVIGNAIVCILLRFRYMQCVRTIKARCFGRAKQFPRTMTYRERLARHLWADEYPSSQQEYNCDPVALDALTKTIHQTVLLNSNAGSYRSEKQVPLERKTATNDHIRIAQTLLEDVHSTSVATRRDSTREPSVTSLFLFNLSLSDFLMAILCIPPYIVTEVAAFFWPFGEPLCKLISYAQGITIFVSSFTHVVIALDRLVLVYFPLRPRMRHCTAACLLIGVWLLASVIPLPIPIVNRVMLSQAGTHCVEDWSVLFSNLTTKGTVPHMEYFLRLFHEDTTIELRSTYTVILMILQYFVPLSIICVAYTAIAIRVTGMKTPGERDLSRDQKLIKARKKTVKMLMTVAVLYGVAHLPHHVLYLHGSIHHEFWKHSWAVRLWAVATLVRDSSTCYNPFIYAWVNKAFRKDVYRLFNLCFTPCRILDRKRRECLHGERHGSTDVQCHPLSTA